MEVNAPTSFDGEQELGVRARRRLSLHSRTHHSLCTQSLDRVASAPIRAEPRPSTRLTRLAPAANLDKDEGEDDDRDNTGMDAGHVEIEDVKESLALRVSRHRYPNLSSFVFTTFLTMYHSDVSSRSLSSTL